MRSVVAVLLAAPMSVTAVTDKELMCAFAATGCPNTAVPLIDGQGHDKTIFQMNWWRASQARALNDMRAYCNLVKSGRANKRQRNYCCGTGKTCTPTSCTKQAHWKVPCPATAAPTTFAPTTEAPTTEAPTTEAPTTIAPTTSSPTEYPTEVPTAQPTDEPTQSPTQFPTYNLAVQFGIDEELDHAGSPQTINFPQFFSGDQPPVIIAGIPSTNGPDYFAVRVKEVTQNGFKFFGDEASCNDKIHYIKERVPWMAVNHGRHNINGAIIEAGTVKLATMATAATVTFNGDIPNAIVLATIQTANGKEAINVRIQSRSDKGFSIRTQLDEGNRGKQGSENVAHAEETIGWVAISAGDGTLAGQAYSASHPKMPVTNPNVGGEQHQAGGGSKNVFFWHTLGDKPLADNDCSFGTFSFNGRNSAILRTMNGKFTIQEDYCADTERWHKAEELSLLVVPGCKTTQQHRAGITGDPFVMDSKGSKVQFFLPLHVDMHLLTCNAMDIYGSAFGTGIEGDHQQWFEKFVVKVDGMEAVVVQVGKNVTSLPDEADVSTHNTDITKQLKIIHVSVEGVPMSKTGAVTVGDSLLAVWQTETAETIQFSHGNSVFQITTAVAQKFTKQHEQMLYTHLDLRFIEMKTEQCTAGILAEIWGAVEMSSKTSAMLQPQEAVEESGEEM